MLINIGVEYLALVSSIQKNWKDKNRNLTEVVLQIIRYFKFMKGNKKIKVMQTSALLIHRAPKRSCKNKKYVKKDLTIHYTDQYLIKNPELQAKYALCQIRPQGS